MRSISMDQGSLLSKVYGGVPSEESHIHLHTEAALGREDTTRSNNFSDGERASDRLVRALEAEGVQWVFGIPGEETLALIESLRKSTIELVLTRHEQAAAFMAATHGRLTGRPGVCLSTLGPGALNLTTGAAYALLGGMPMIMIAGQKAIGSTAHGRFQMVDTVAVMKPLTKSALQLVNPTGIPAAVRDAFRIAAEERPGPVYIELPEDVAAMRCTAAVLPRREPDKLIASPEMISRAARTIDAAERPLVMIGADCNRPGVARHLRAFLDFSQLPFFSTQLGKGAMSEGSHLCVGTAVFSEGELIHDRIAAADLLISVGHSTVEKPPFLVRANGPTVLHVGFRGAEIEHEYNPQIELVGDLSESLGALTGSVRPRTTGHISRPARPTGFAQSGGSNGTLSPFEMVSAVQQVMADDGMVCLDNGMFKLWFARCYRAASANSLLLDNALATMGAGLPSAICAALLQPGRRILAVCGDGGFLMNSQELETAVRLGLSLVVLVLEDGGYGMIRWKQGRDGMASNGVDFGNPDFVQYASAYGARGWAVSTAEELAQVLDAGFASTGVHLVRVRIDYGDERPNGGASPTG